ncbi:MAG: putative transporter permease protein [Frankiales bacterium]|nr:putative transporter permease protein [Frankiales bacterium]
MTATVEQAFPDAGSDGGGRLSGLRTSTRARSTSSRVALGAFVLVLAYLVLVPLFKLQQLAVADDFRGYRVAFGDGRIWETVRTTVYLAVGSLAIAMVLGTGLAFAASRLPVRWRGLRSLPVLPIVVPGIASVTGWIFLLSPRPGYLNAALRNLPWWNHLEQGPVDVYSLPWIILITGFGLTSFVYLFVSSGLSGISSEHVEAAEVAGSSSIGVFFRVILPLLRPALVYGAGIALLLGLGQFAPPLLLGTNTGISVLTTDMYAATSQSPVDYGAAAAIGSPLLVFGLLVVIGQKAFLGDQARFVTHGGKGFQARRRSSPLSVLAIVLYCLVATVLPITGLLLVALSPFWSGTLDPGTFSLDSFRTVFGQSDIVTAILTSLTASLLAVLIVVPIGFVCASVLLRGQRFRILRQVLDYLVAVPLGIPAVVFGAGFLLTYSAPPFILYGTKSVIVLVYVTIMLPFATRMLLTGMTALGSSYIEASRVSGAGLLGTNLRILAPLLRSTAAGAVALIFVLLAQEFGASLLVRSSTTQVMGTVLFDYYTNGAYPTVAAVALIMTAVTAAGVVVALVLGGRNALDKL